MYHRKPKVPKKFLGDTGWYTIFNCDKLSRPEWTANGPVEYYRIMSIDSATLNYCVRIERWHLTGLQKGRIIPEVAVKVNLKSEDPLNTNFIFNRLTVFLMKYLELIQSCHFILSERQLSINYPAVRISTWTLAMLTLYTENKGNKPIIIELHPRLKYVQLDAPKGQTETQLKKVWTPQKTLEILEERGDQWSIDLINRSKKKDDYCDTIIQVVAFVILTEIIPITMVKLVIKIPLLPEDLDPITEVTEPTDKKERKLIIKTTSIDGKLAENTVKDNTVKDNTVKDNTVKDNTVTENITNKNITNKNITNKNITNKNITNKKVVLHIR